VDEEIINYITEAEQKAVSLLTTHRASLDRIAESLLDKETLDADEFAKLMGVPKAKAI